MSGKFLVSPKITFLITCGIQKTQKLIPIKSELTGICQIWYLQTLFALIKIHLHLYPQNLMLQDRSVVVNTQSSCNISFYHKYTATVYNSLNIQVNNSD